MPEVLELRIASTRPFEAAEILNELNLEPREHLLKPLFEGKWQ
jgi:hypothetical protein